MANVVDLLRRHRNGLIQMDPQKGQTDVQGRGGKGQAMRKRNNVMGATQKRQEENNTINMT